MLDTVWLLLALLEGSNRTNLFQNLSSTIRLFIQIVKEMNNPCFHLCFLFSLFVSEFVVSLTVYSNKAKETRPFSTFSIMIC